MNDLVLIQQDRPSVQIQDTATITVLDSPDIVNVENNANIIVSNSDLPVFVKYSTQKGEDGHTPTNEEITDLVTPEFIISKLTGQIKSTELYGDLASRIDKIAVLENSVFNLNNAIASTVTETSVAAILEDYSTTATTTNAIAQTRDGLLATMGNNIAASLSEYTVSADLDGAVATKVDTLIAATGNSLGDLSAALKVEQKVRAQTIAPLWVDNKEYQKGETVMVSDITNPDGTALYQCITPLLGSNMGVYPPASATNWKLVQANLYAQYAVKTDVNGHVAGFGLANDGATSDFIVLADRFSISDPNDPTEKAIPFIVNDGQVYINSAMINDATITMAKIVNQIKSLNYVAGSAGWSIPQNGSPEFNGGTFRGTVQFTTPPKNATGVAIAVDNAAAITTAAADATSKANLALASANTASETARNMAANVWVRPGQTTIDGNKISTGDLGVDTLQIKGEAVTVSVAAYSGSPLAVGTGARLAMSLPYVVDATMVGLPVSVTTCIAARAVTNNSELHLILKVKKNGVYDTVWFAGSTFGTTEYNFHFKNSYPDHYQPLNYQPFMSQFAAISTIKFISAATYTVELWTYSSADSKWDECNMLVQTSKR